MVNYQEKFFRETINCIQNIDSNVISVKVIRRFYKISSKNRSKINFYWRCLRRLERMGYIKRLTNSRYEILKIPGSIFIEEFDEHRGGSCEFCGLPIFSRKSLHINIGTGITHVFCTVECKIKWIFKRQAKKLFNKF